MKPRIFRVFLFFAAAGAVLSALPVVYFSTGRSFAGGDAPAQAARGYLMAVYARDYPKAYQWISVEDQKLKSAEEYLAENPSFSGAALALAYRLANEMEWRELRSEVHGDRATVHFKVRLPDANAPALQELFLDFDRARLSRLTGREKREIERKLELMESRGTLPVVEGKDSLELVKEQDRWRVSADWNAAIRIRFRAEVKEGLAWDFRPVQETILAKPGETFQALYKAKNLSDRPLTAKATHLSQPKGAAEKYLDMTQCFCFIQQTLAAGEEKEFALVLRVDPAVPADLKEFSVSYRFYPLEKFPKK